MIGTLAGAGTSFPRPCAVHSEAKSTASTQPGSGRPELPGRPGGRLSEDQVSHVKNVATADRRQAQLQDYHQTRFDTATKHAVKLRELQTKATTPEARERIQASLNQALKQRIEARKAMETIPKARARLTAMSNEVMAHPHVRPRGLSA